MLFIGFFGLVAWHGWGVVEQSWVSESRSHTALETPTVIPQFLWIVGLVILILIGVVLFVYAVSLLFRGEIAAATRMISTRSAAEDVEEEIRFLHERRSKEAGS